MSPDETLAQRLGIGRRVNAKPERVRSLPEQVWDAPATFNRATRRAAGLLSRIWRWDQAAFGNEPQEPRYIRRHFAPAMVEMPAAIHLTRRQRRHRARILRIVRARGG